MSDPVDVKGSEFIRRVLKRARQLDIPARVDKKRGKGSHVTLYYGDHVTVVRDPKRELKSGTLAAMLRQLGLSRKDI